ncbi:MAG: hypothetical protein ACW98Y_07570 [Candidatus Thorarchaeota archaeon]|jgi:RNA polymerase subunit RPABC4/transcription elongation factor Spt4
MKASKKCPNCQSRKIAGPHRDMGYIIAKRYTGHVGTESYACVECGFIQKFVREKEKTILKRKGKFTLNPPNPEQTHCPECKSKFKENTFQCHNCGYERDFDYLDADDAF